MYCLPKLILKYKDKKMSKQSIESIVLDTFKELNVDFTGRELLEAVRFHPRCEYTFDSTIFRALRKLRENGKINYNCIDIKKSQFRKAIYMVKALSLKIPKDKLPKEFSKWSAFSGRISNMTINEIEKRYFEDTKKWNLSIFEYIRGSWNFITTIG